MYSNITLQLPPTTFLWASGLWTGLDWGVIFFGGVGIFCGGGRLYFFF